MQYRATTLAVLDYIKAEFDSEPEFLWAKTPNNAAFRHQGTKKWFAALLLDMPGNVLGLSEADRFDVLNLKCDPVMRGSLLDGRHFLPGYHMNKEHWISVVLDDTLSLQELLPLIDMSYGLVSGKK